MKKNLMIVSFAFIFLLSMSIVSAGWFSDLFSGKATGDAVITGRVNQCTGNSMCWDCDNEASCTAGGCSWDGEQCNQKGIFSGGEHCINPDQPCPMREGAGFQAAAGTDTQFAVRSVDTRTGFADVVVKYADGRLETVTAAEGGRAILTDGSVLRIREIERKAFSRGATVNMEVVTPAGEEGVGARVGGVAGVVTGAHTHLVDYYEKSMYVEIPFEQFGAGSQKYVLNTPDKKVLMTYSAGTPTGNVLGTENVIVAAEFFCDNPEDVAIGGFYAFDLIDSDKDGFVKYNILSAGNLASQYRVLYKESTADGSGERINGITVYVTCARLENAIDSGEPHF